MSAPFDTLQLARRFEAAGFDPKQAGDMAAAIAEATASAEREFPLTDQEKAARESFFHEQTPGFPWWVVALVACVLWLGSAVIVWVNHKTHRTLASIVVAAWVILPPLWFVAEYNFMFYRRFEALPSPEAFKHSQELARNFWLAGVVIMLFLLTEELRGSS